MKISLLPYLICPSCHLGSLKAISFGKKSQGISSGVLLCISCRQWYLIEDGVLELLTPDLNHDRRTFFYESNLQHFKKLQLQATKKSRFRTSRQASKIHQSHFFDSFSEHYVLETQPFWKAYYRRSLRSFTQLLHPHSLILDVGCGNGLSSFPLLREGHTIIGADISRQMIKDAVSKSQHSKAHYLVADAENLPFRNGVFDACIGFGILHHVTAPEKTIEHISRCLKKGGIYFGHENNKSLFRPVFDFLMKIFELWHEEAGDHQLFSQEELQNICQRYHLHLNVQTHVFLPPHFFNLFKTKQAETLIEFTDSFFQHLPFIKHHGGTLLFQAKKI